MPRKDCPITKHGVKTGPLKSIDWDFVDEQLALGCDGTEVAAALGICADTLYNRCASEKGVLFSVYSQQKKESGIKNDIRKAQLELIKEKNPSMCIFLGKVILKQKESEQVADEATKAAVVEYLNKLSQKSDP